MSSDPKPVSLSPVQFVEPSIYEMTAGDVIRQYHIQEAKRKRDEGEYKERDVMVSFRTAPDGIIGAVDNVARRSGMRKSVITKCLSLHLMSWYQSLPQVAVLVDTYQTLQDNADGYPDIWRKMESDGYEFMCPRSTAGNNKSYMRTIAYILGYLGDISDPLGVPASKLFLVGLCWSLSTNTERWADATVRKYLLPEAERMIDYINERVSLFRYIDELIKVRCGLRKVEDITSELKLSIGSGVPLSPNNHIVGHG